MGGDVSGSHTDQTITLSVANGSLSTGGRGGGAWMPLAADHFRAPLGDVTLSGAAGGRALRLIRADGDTVRYEEVRPAASPRIEDYAGTYTSDELDVVLTLAVKDGKLVMRRRPADEFELRPVYTDDFQAGGGLGTVGLHEARTAGDGRGLRGAGARRSVSSPSRPGRRASTTLRPRVTRRAARGRSARPVQYCRHCPAILPRLALQTPGRLGAASVCTPAHAPRSSHRRSRSCEQTSERAGGTVRSGAEAVLPGSVGNTALVRGG